MKKFQSTSKSSHGLTNIIMQLLRWLTKLELSGGPVGEQDIGQILPESPGKLMPVILNLFQDPYTHFMRLRNEFGVTSSGGFLTFNKQTKNENTMKTNNRLTKLIMQLLRWMSHLELSGSSPGEQDIGQVLPEPAFAGLPNEIQNFKNLTQNENIMKSKNQILKWLALLFVLFASTMAAWAQPAGLTQSGDHSVCLGETKDYGVDPTANTTYLWTITPIISGNGSFTTGTTSNLTSIKWTTAGTARLELSETNVTGCNITVSIVVTVNSTPILTITNPAAICAPGTIDLTAAAITAGSTLPTGTSLSYWTNAAATTPLATPTAVTASGTYYIKAGTAAGCSDLKPVNVTVNPVPVLTLHDPAAICAPGTIDLTAAAITAGSTLPTGTSLSYWTDAAATTPLATPTAVTASGTYYIKAATAAGCSDVKPVNVTINAVPTLTLHDPAPVCSPGPVDLTAAAITAGSTLPTGTSLSYWTDAAATTPLATPSAVTASGTYYIKAGTAAGCSDIKSVNVTINPLPTTSIIWHN